MAEELKQKGIQHFANLLKHKSQHEIYFHLIDQANWDGLINDICLNMKQSDDKIKRLKTLKNVAEKAAINEKYRTIAKNHKFTQKKLLNIHGSMVFLRAIGFEEQKDHNDEILKLEYTQQHILDKAINSLNYKIKLLKMFEVLQNTWGEMIETMYNDPHFFKQANVLDSLVKIDFINDIHSYYEIISKVNAVTSVVTSDNDKWIPVKLIEQLGLTLTPDDIIDQSLTTKVLTTVNKIYLQVKKIAQSHQKRHERQQLTLSSQTLCCMCLELNKLWQKCLKFMHQQETFTQQSVFLNKIKPLDLSVNTDYNYLLKKIRKVGSMNIYS
eukprot:492277_1